MAESLRKKSRQDNRLINSMSELLRVRAVKMMPDVKSIERILFKVWKYELIHKSQLMTQLSVESEQM